MPFVTLTINSERTDHILRGSPSLAFLPDKD